MKCFEYRPLSGIPFLHKSGENKNSPPFKKPQFPPPPPVSSLNMQRGHFKMCNLATHPHAHFPTRGWGRTFCMFFSCTLASSGIDKEQKISLLD